MELKDYLLDGAGMQARCVLCYIQNHVIEESWDSELKYYKSKIEVGRWENCREQGYCVSLVNESHHQINIAFFEHRNSDNICAVVWQELTINTPTIDSKELGKVYKTKYYVTKEVSYMHIKEMGNWITDELDNWWIENK